MINVYKSLFSLQWESHALMLPLCCGGKKTLHSCCSSALTESYVRFSLKHFRPKQKKRRKKPRWLALLASRAPLRSPPPLPPTVLDCARRKQGECSWSSHSQLVCLLSSPCCVAHHEPMFAFAVFLLWVEWQLFAVYFFLFVFVLFLFFCFVFLKTSDVFMSLMSAPDQGYRQPCWYCMLT